jgi:iron complex outermembrane recepter protein
MSATSWKNEKFKGESTMFRWSFIPKKSLVLSSVISAIILPAVTLPVFAQKEAEEEDIEEVIVTGPYLRGTPLDAPSPVQVVDRTSIEAQGAAQIWDVIKNLEINSGSITNEGADTSSASMGTLFGTANVNLRNLGENSTLTLINFLAL